MENSERCLSFAAQTDELALDSPDSAVRAVYRDIARAWRHAAEAISLRADIERQLGETKPQH